jgi:hypothetical protein
MSAPTPSEAPSFQARMDEWLLACFGEKIARDKAERNHRFLEEALELVQALGCTASEAHQLVDYTFGRPSGEAFQEVGGVVTTLAALCLAHGFDMQQAAEAELARIWTKVETIRAKQAAKPKHSPLPAAAPTPSEAVRVAVQECKRLAEDFAYENAMGAVYKTSAGRTDKRRAKLHAAIDALAALSLHVGDAADVRSDALGATLSGSGSAAYRPEPL